MGYQGTNHRATANLVVDGGGETHSLGEAYPTTRGGQVFGYVGTVETRDRAAVDRRVSGCCYGSGQVDFRMDLLSTGVGTIRLALGDLASSGAQYAQLLDDGVVFATISGTTNNTQQMLDATGVARAADTSGAGTWTALNAPITHNFTSTNFTVRLGDGSGQLARLAHVSVDIAASDTTAPTLSTPTATPTGPTTATGTVSTTEANGTLFRITSTNATETGPTLIASGAQTTVTATGVQNISATGLTASTANLRHHFVHRDAAGNVSNVQSSAAFSTPAAGDSTPPSLGAVTAAATAPTVVTGSVSTNEAGGALYRRVSANATESQVTMEAGGLFQSVTATGVQSVTAAAPAGTNGLRLHLMHVDASGNKSTVVSSAPFATPVQPAGGTITIREVRSTVNLAASVAGHSFHVLNHATMASVKVFNNLSTNADGDVVITDPLIVPGTVYSVPGRNAAGDVGNEKYTAT